MKGSLRKGIAGGAVIALLGAGFAATAAAQQEETHVIPLTDPSRPAKIEAHLLNGRITVRGENRRDVAVMMRTGDRRGPQPDRDRSTPPGMKRLTQGQGFEITEERNEIKIESNSLRGGGGGLELRVPLRTHLDLASVNGGGITVENVEGDLEIQSTNGTVVLDNVAGSVVADSTNGGVKAALTRVTADKPMSFSSLNGNVDVTLPGNLRASLKMRSDNGDVFTDFDVQLRQDSSTPRGGTRRGGELKIEVNRALFGTVNGGGPEIELRSFNGNIYLRKGQ